MAADGTSFRDLNGNGELDPYEDARLPVEDRVADLLARMTLEEKAAQLFHQGLLVPDDGAVGEEPEGFSSVATRTLVAELGLTHFNIYWTPGPVTLAEWHNRMQEAAEATRLGIPVTISSDPRHGLGDNPATSMAGAGFSKWPDPIGLAATRDAGARARVRRRRATGVSGRRHPAGAPPDRRSRDRAALVPCGRNLRRGRRARREPGDRLHPRHAARDARARERRLHDEALPRRRATARRRGSALRLRPRAGLPRRQLRLSPRSRSRPRSRPGPRRSCPTTGCRSGPNTRRSASGSTTA